MLNGPLAAAGDTVPASRSEAYEAASVAVLLCTRNGERYLAEQMASLEHQVHQKFQVFVSDDGSSDSTLSILEEHKKRWGEGRISLVSGPLKGFARNFLSVSCRSEVQADYYAWCDQDDIWGEDKLQKAVRWLAQIPADTPALYCSRTELINEAGQHIGFSPLFTKPANFRNALVQNIAGGNTMVFNQALMDLLREAGDSVPAVSHDWWAYMIVSGCGGRIFYDLTPSVLYRQHDANCVGTNKGVRESGKRIKQLLRGRYSVWMDSNMAALQSISHRFTPENQITLERFAQARKSRLMERVLGVRQAGVYRQTLMGNIGLAVATLISRV